MKNFKLIALVTVLIVSVSLAGCKKDPEPSIIGVWEVDDFNVDGTYNGLSIGALLLFSGYSMEDIKKQVMDSVAGETFEFLEDGTFKSTYGSGFVQTGTWKEESDYILTITSANTSGVVESKVFEIKSLSEDEMQLYNEDKVDLSTMDFGMEGNANVNLTFDLIRQ